MALSSCVVEPLITDKLFRVVPNEAHTAENDRAVLFVHGFLGNAQDTWKHAASVESFPSLLATDPELSDHDFFLFQYVTKDLNPPAIDNIVLQLKFVINQKFKGKRIIFVAHSMGGLVAMRCILRLLEDGESESISGLLLYGSPMTGVEWAKYAQLVLQLATFKLPVFRLISRFIKTNKQVSALTTGSEFIDRLNGSWVLRVLNGGHPKVIAAQRAWFPVRVVSGNDDWVVKESSARGFYTDIDWINIDQDHRTLVKPRDRFEFTYQIASNFLKDCRNWINPKALLKLRSQIDDLWSFHQERTISNWHFDLSFDSQEAPLSGAFGLPRFRPFTVVECSYHRRMETEILKFGFAVGPIAVGKIWTDEFVFLHSISFGALPPDVTQTLQDQLRMVLNNRSTAWSTLFDNVSIRIRRPDEISWHDLVPAELDAPNDGLVRSFRLPQDARTFLGQEAVVDVSFRGLLPLVINDYTVQFPWLCDSFVTQVTIKGNSSYLICEQAMRGEARINFQQEQQSKIECSSEDLIIPKSYLQFEWGF